MTEWTWNSDSTKITDGITTLSVDVDGDLIFQTEDFTRGITTNYVPVRVLLELLIKNAKRDKNAPDQKDEFLDLLIENDKLFMALITLEEENRKLKNPTEKIRLSDLSGHNYEGNCWDKACSCEHCKPLLCDVCHEHDQPRGDCQDCPRCEICDAQ